jgi:hypothetical protein
LAFVSSLLSQGWTVSWITTLSSSYPSKKIFRLKDAQKTYFTYDQNGKVLDWLMEIKGNHICVLDGQYDKDVFAETISWFEKSKKNVLISVSSYGTPKGNSDNFYLSFNTQYHKVLLMNYLKH